MTIAKVINGKKNSRTGFTQSPSDVNAYRKSEICAHHNDLVSLASTFKFLKNTTHFLSLRLSR